MQSRRRRGMWLVLLANLAGSAGASAVSKAPCVDPVVATEGARPEYPHGVCSTAHAAHGWQHKTWKSTGWHDQGARKPREWRSAARAASDAR